MTAVAGIDPALGGTGYAGPDGRCWLLTEKPILGPYERMSRIANRLDRLIADHEPELVILEGYGGAGPGRLSTIRGIELGGLLRIACHGRLLPWADFAPNTLKAYATGFGMAEKDLMAEVYRERFAFSTDGLSHDEIDASWLRDLGRWLLLDPEAVGPHPDCATKIVDGILDRAAESLGASSLRLRETQ
jgi:Holliday junction resolvasome RuvABC endonuclease subunit